MKSFFYGLFAILYLGIAIVLGRMASPIAAAFFTMCFGAAVFKFFHPEVHRKEIRRESARSIRS